MILNAVSILKPELSMTMGIDSCPSTSLSLSNGTGGKMTERVRKIVTRVFSLYCRTVLEQNSLDFDNLIFKVRELPIVDSKVRYNMRRRWEHVLVSDFQGQLD